MRLLMDEPNVLLLDEPTNDLDIDTLTALEDLLDGWPGTLVVVSHDRYFVERVTDDVYALAGDGSIRHLPGGIEQYVELRHAAAAADDAPVGAAPAKAAPSGAVVRAARKEVSRLERALDKLTARETQLHEDMAASATDHTRLRELQSELAALSAEREQLESAWLETSEELEG
jgi:ATP-binding cassette subfamily F protein uup